MKINIRFIKVSQFLHQFNLKIKHKFKKKYIISNTLSRLTNVNQKQKCFISQYSKLNALFAYTLMKMFDDFRYRFIKGYKNDS